MKLEEIIDLRKLKTHISDVGAKSALSHAKDLAYELASTGQAKKSIASTYSIYNELADVEIGTEQVLSAITSMYSYLPTVEEKEKFCNYGYPTLKI